MWKARKLQCKVQNYEWGMRGVSCHVGRLFFIINSCSEFDNSVPFAELWMGTHESGHSLVCFEEHGDTQESKEVKLPLKKWLQSSPSVLGDKVLQRWGVDLPFLFKVLSVDKALSIQAHPDKNLASVLHQAQPNIYKDSNHKPEMALALTEFEALCGFVCMKELKGTIQTVPELACILGQTEVEALLDMNTENCNEEYAANHLRSAFTKLMTIDKEVVTTTILKLKKRLNEESQVRELTFKEKLVFKLEKEYPCDIGVLAAFFLNYIKLAPGEALYVPANEPHAYLYGECVECMATSDNVVRAGLTPKYRDVETLCAMLTYKQGLPTVLKGSPVNSSTTRYSPPFDEFEVDRCILPSGASVTFPSIAGPSIFLVLQGEGLMRQQHENEELRSSFQEGDILFVPTGTQLEFSSCVEDNGYSLEPSYPVHIYRAGVNSKIF